MLSRLERRQLIAFGVVTVLVVSVLANSFLNLGQLLGVGRITVTVDLPTTGGLYERANVNYRGHEIGVVTDVDLRRGGGAVATLQIDDDAAVPRDARVQVRSVSALGEQYVDFIPAPAGSSTAALGDGDAIPESQAVLPVTTGRLLTDLNDLVSSVDEGSLRTMVRELGQAFESSGEDIGRFLDATIALTQSATDNLPQTLQLIEDLPTVLRTQEDLDPSIRSYARSLEGLSSELQEGDGDLRALLGTTAPALEEFTLLARGLRDVAPDVLEDLAIGGEVLDVYSPAIEHVLTILPAITVAIVAANSPNQDVAASGRRELNLYFKANVGDPPPCTEGFEEAGRERSPYSDIEPAPIPSGYCKIAIDDPRVVRGARNQPCPNDPDRRSATAAGCGLVFDREVVRTQSAGDGTSVAGPAGGLDLLASLLSTTGGGMLMDPARTWQDLLRGVANGR